MFENILINITVLPLLGILLLLLVPHKNFKMLKLIALNFSSLPLIGSLILWFFFKDFFGQFQFVTKLYWFSSFNVNLALGIDGISLFF